MWIQSYGIACVFSIEVLGTFLSLLVPPYSDKRYFEVEEADKDTPRPLIYIPSFSSLIVSFRFAGAAGSPN